MGLDYARAGHFVREDFKASHQRFWDRLAGPGCWWTGEQRVAIAAEARRAQTCELCRTRKAALSPYAIDGEHAEPGEHGGALPRAAVDVIHRIATDASRLTRSWFDALVPDELTDGEFVEIVGTVVAVISIDSFCKGLGLAPHPLPQARAGEPTRYRPPSAEPDGAWVALVPLENAGTPEADLWVAGKTGYVIRAMSLVPDEVRTLNDLSTVHYLPSGRVRDASFAKGALTRPQMELVAGRVSALNGCHY